MTPTHTHTDTHGLHLNQEGRDRLFDLEAQTKVLTCTSSNRVDMFKCVQTWTHTRLLSMCVLTFFLGHKQTVRHIVDWALTTSSWLILGQRWTQLTTDYWLVQLVTVISCGVIWHLGLAVPRLLLTCQFFRSLSNFSQWDAQKVINAENQRDWFKSPPKATDSGLLGVV